MSFDLAIEQLCTHLVVDEVRSIDLSDLKTVRTLRPISSTAVEMKINGFLIENPADPDVGFVLVRDETSIDPTARMIQFRKLRKATDEFYEVTYYTHASNCRRCQGLRVEQDYRYNDLGGIVAIRDEMKLIQDLKKIVLTQIGSNPFHTWYGTSIPGLIGSKIANAGFIRAKMSGDIQTALRRYMDIQRRQSRLQKVTAKEKLARVLEVVVTQDEYEPTAFNVKIAFVNQARDVLFVEQGIVLPAPESLVYYTASGDVAFRGNPGTARR